MNENCSLKLHFTNTLLKASITYWEKISVSNQNMLRGLALSFTPRVGGGNRDAGSKRGLKYH